MYVILKMSEEKKKNKKSQIRNNDSVPESNVKITEITDESSAVVEAPKNEELKIMKKTLYRYKTDFLLKPEDKIRRHLEDALYVSGLEPDIVSQVTKFLCDNGLIFNIINPNAFEVFIANDKVYGSETDAHNDTNLLQYQVNIFSLIYINENFKNYITIF